MNAYALTPLARADLFDIWSYIAAHSEKAADRVNKRFMTVARSSPKARCEGIPGRI
jgi:plasmid stabilization system protein ParE